MSIRNHDAGGDAAFASAARALWVAVIAQAIRDAFANDPLSHPEYRRHKRDARSWLLAGGRACARSVRRVREHRQGGCARRVPLHRN